MAEFDRTMPNQLGFDISGLESRHLVIKLHVTECGFKELDHLLEMLQANIENLPTIVVKAMQALADTMPAIEEDSANVEA